MRRRSLAPLVLTILIAPIAPAGQEQTAQPVSITPVARTEEWASKRQEEVLRRVRDAKAPVPVVFLGDSITQGWEGPGAATWTAEVAPHGAMNLGVSGDRTEHVLWRLGQAPLTAVDPKAVIVMIGTNNLGHGSSGAADTALGVRTIVDTLARQCPNARIVVLGIFPRGETMNGMRGDICQINQSLARFAADHSSKRVEFRDIGADFIEADGTIRKEIMPDFLHLSPEGYRRWAAAIKPCLPPVAAP